MEHEKKNRRLVDFHARKECLALGPHPQCDRQCHSRGTCDSLGRSCQTIGSVQSGHHCFPRCVCRPGWEGEDCSQPVCAPQCMNGGSCSAPGAALDQAHVHKDHQNRSEPHAHARTHLQRGDSSLISGVCDCPAGFQGRSCEGGICSLPCQHGGQCIQRDTCRCLTGNREVPN